MAQSRHFIENYHRRPHMIDPWIVDRTAAQDHTDLADDSVIAMVDPRSPADQASFADDASGSPATRFCGFRRTTLSAPIARMR